MARCEVCGDEIERGHKGSDGLVRCAVCQRIRKRELTRARGRKFTQANPERRRTQIYRHKYGIDHDEFLRLLESQDGLCAVCRCPETTRDSGGVPRALSVDHDHASAVVRGLLCHLCNTALGALKEDVSLMLSLIEYVLQWSA